MLPSISRGEIRSEILNKKSIFKWILFGIILRLIVMPISVHGDLILSNWVSGLVAIGHYNLYLYLSDVYQATYTSYPSPYPPAYYYLIAGWLSILNNFHLISLSAWESPWAIDNLNRSIFLFKIPLLIFDLLTGYVLIQMVDKQYRKLILILWLLCPVTIFVSYMFGQFDIIPTFFVVLALYYAKRALDEKNLDSRLNSYAVISMLALGIGACLKHYPFLLLLPFIIIIGKKNIKKAIPLSLLGISPYILSILFFVKSEAFRRAVLLFPENQWILNFFFDIGLGHVFYVFLIGYFALLFYILYINKEISFDVLFKSCFAILTLFFITTLWLPQWYVWIMPFVILVITRYQNLLRLYFVQIAFFSFYILWWGNFLGAGLFSPINPIFNDFQGINEIISSIYPYNKLLGIFYTLFIVISLGMVYLTFKNSICTQNLVYGRNNKIMPSKFSLIIPVLILFSILLSSIILGGGSYIGLVQDKVNQPVGEISGITTVGQTFISPHANLNAIEINMATYMRTNTHDVIFHLRSSPNSTVDIVTIRVNAAKIADNKYHRFSFPPIIDSEHISYYFFIESPNSAPGNAITTGYCTKDVYNAGSAYKNHEPMEGDLSFRTYHKLEMSNVASYFLHRMQQDMLFFIFYFLLLGTIVYLILKLHLEIRMLKK